MPTKRRKERKKLAKNAVMNRRKIWEWCLFMVKGKISGNHFAKLTNNYEINSVIISWMIGNL